MSILELFCHVDDFWKTFEPHWRADLLASGRQLWRARSLAPSEIMTILILFQQSHSRDFKAFYTELVRKHLRSEFPGFVSSTRFVEFMPSVLAPLC